MILQIILLVLILGFFASLYALFHKCFCRQKPKAEDALPGGMAGDPYREEMLQGIHLLLEEEYEKVRTIAYDGLKLEGFYYEHVPGAPVMICFHGYRSPARRDSSGIYQICKQMGVNVLIVEQRGHGKSDGVFITFGLKERYDVISWIEYVQDRCGGKTRIMLAGLSMGAGTVLMASGFPLPETVRGISADCGYDTIKGVICQRIKDMNLPVGPTYALVRLSARMFGRFDPDFYYPKMALEKNTKIPVLFIHGTGDRSVPCQMAENNYRACAAEKQLLLVENAPHGASFYYDREAYCRTVKEFMKTCGFLS